MADASSVAGPFPFREGFKANLHTLAHGWNKPEGAVALGKWDKFMTEQILLVAKEIQDYINKSYDLSSPFSLFSEKEVFKTISDDDDGF